MTKQNIKLKIDEYDVYFYSNSWADCSNNIKINFSASFIKNGEEHICFHGGKSKFITKKDAEKLCRIILEMVEKK